jgi:hypothetical protein
MPQTTRPLLSLTYAKGTWAVSSCLVSQLRFYTNVHISHAWHIPCPLEPLSLDMIKPFWWGARITMLLTMKSSPCSCQFGPVMRPQRSLLCTSLPAQHRALHEQFCSVSWYLLPLRTPWDNMAPARKSPPHIPEVRFSAGDSLSIRGLIEQISWNLPGTTEEHHESV